VRARSLAARVVACRRCPRLRAHCRAVAAAWRARRPGAAFWGRPVPGLRSARPRLLVVGLAPGALGANRTGRVFTGDASGAWLFRAMHASGFCDRPVSRARGDGLRLLDAAVTGAARCAPPDNRPRAAELDACRPFLVEEVRAFRALRAVVALGRIAFDQLRRAWVEAGRAPFPRAAFRHGGAWTAPGPVTLLASYHPSRRNTQTGLLSRRAFHAVFRRTRWILDKGAR